MAGYLPTTQSSNQSAYLQAMQQQAQGQQGQIPQGQVTGQVTYPNNVSLPIAPNSNNPMSLIATGQNSPAALLQQAQSQEAAFTTTAPSQYNTPINRANNPVTVPANLPYGTLGSYMDGVFKGRADQRADIGTNNQTQMVDMAQQKQGWEQTDREKERSIQDGMMQAANNGGYSGVIDYLQSADPTRAMAFSKAKNDLDQSMMQTDIMKALMPAKQVEAMTEGYGALGKMGQALLNAPAQDRQNMYNIMLPMVKAINPNAPSNVNQAASMFLLSASQAAPENLLFSNMNNNVAMQSEVGKVIGDIHTAQLKYGINSPQVNTLASSLGQVITKQGLGNVNTLQQVQQSASKYKLDGETALRSEFNNADKEFQTVKDGKLAMDNLQPQYNDPTVDKGLLDLPLLQNYVKMYDPTLKIRPGTTVQAADAPGIPSQILATINKVTGGGSLSQEDRNTIFKTGNTMYDAYEQSHNAREAKTREIATSNGWDPNNVIGNIDTQATQGTQSINQMAQSLVQAHPDQASKIEEARQASLKELNMNAQNNVNATETFLRNYGRIK